MSGPKKVICSICGKEVLKSRTYFVGDGKRACKEHEGVKDKSASLQEAEKKEKEKHKREQAKRKKRDEFRVSSTEHFEDLFKTVRLSTGTVKVHPCWCCRKKGIMLRDLFAASAIAMKRKQLRGDPLDFFNMSSDIKKELRIPDGYVSVNTIAVKADDLKRINKALSWDMQTVVQASGFVLCCEPCAKKMKLEFMPPLPEVKLEDLLKVSAITDPVLTDIAKQTLEEDKNIN